MFTVVTDFITCPLFSNTPLAFSYYFFFSSRRRHTRFDCDWSSDVCRLRLRSEEHTSELQSQSNLVCRLLLEKKKTTHGKEQQNSADGIGIETEWNILGEQPSLTSRCGRCV